MTQSDQKTWKDLDLFDVLMAHKEVAPEYGEAAAAVGSAVNRFNENPSVRDYPNNLSTEFVQSISHVMDSIEKALNPKTNKELIKMLNNKAKGLDESDVEFDKVIDVSATSLCFWLRKMVSEDVASFLSKPVGINRSIAEFLENKNEASTSRLTHVTDQDALMVVEAILNAPDEFQTMHAVMALIREKNQHHQPMGCPMRTHKITGPICMFSWWATLMRNSVYTFESKFPECMTGVCEKLDKGFCLIPECHSLRLDDGDITDSGVVYPSLCEDCQTKNWI